MVVDYMNDDKLWDEVGLALLERIELTAIIQRFREMLMIQDRLLDDAFHALDKWSADGFTSEAYEDTMRVYEWLRDRDHARRDAWQRTRGEAERALVAEVHCCGVNHTEDTCETCTICGRQLERPATPEPVAAGSSGEDAVS
jgi:hypothetical protein